MSKVGFKEAKRRVLAALQSGAFQHETDRKNLDVKNLLHMGKVSASQICTVIQRSTGNDHECVPHHTVPGLYVHIIRSQGWYVKFYFVDESTVFISVHM